MILLRNNLEAYLYHSNRISIKDLNGDIDLNNAKWDFIFHFILKDTHEFYFLGERLEYSDDKLRNLVTYLREVDVEGDDDYHEIFFKVKPAELLISRRSLSNLWHYYEFPAIIFVNGNLDSSQLKILANKNITYEEIVGRMPKMYMIHKNFELNVLWIERGDDMPDLGLLLDSMKNRPT